MKRVIRSNAVKAERRLGQRAVKHGGRSLHPNKGRLSQFIFLGWFTHGTLDRF